MKPDKPYPDFPLFAHANGQWAKKVKGKLQYFGPWDDPEGALATFEGPEPSSPVRGGPLTIEDGCNLFLASKDRESSSGERSRRTFLEYQRTCKRLVAFWGPRRSIISLMPADFTRFKDHRAETCNIVSVGNEVTRVKTWLKWLTKSKYIPEVETGPDFKKPSRKATRRHKRLSGKRMFAPDQIRLLCDYSGIHMRAMILLGINCGFQNADCETIPLAVVEAGIETGWLEFPRGKTEIDRRCHLWKRTRNALEASVKRRHQSKLPCAFVLPSGLEYGSANNDIAKRFRAARDHAGIRSGGFSWLRKTFETVAGKDQVAIDFIMGHADESMAAVYRQEMPDERLMRVSRKVARWLSSPAS